MNFYVRFQCDDPPTDLFVLLGEDRPDVSSGYGGWQEVDRPKRATVTTWVGQPARRLALSVLLDNFQAGASIENDIRTLERLALPRPGGSPPTIQVSAPGGVVPPFYENMDWVIDALSWGDAEMNPAGNRTRQAATVTLLQYVSDDLIQKQGSPAQKRRANAARKKGTTTKKGAKSKRQASHAGRSAPHAATSHALAFSASHAATPHALAPVVVFDGEDLLSVAARELGDATRWHEIAELNGIRDPRAVTRAQVIRLP